MANKAMKQRHWDRIAGLTGHTFDMESETFSLRNIMEAPLLKSKEDIEVRAPLSYPSNSILLEAIFKKTFFQSVTQGGRKKDPSFPNRSENYDLLVTSPSALPLSYRAQLFEGRLALNPGLNLTRILFLLFKRFSWIIFPVIFKSIQSSTCCQKELN